MGFSRPGYWSGEPFPSPRDLPNPDLPHCRRILNQLSPQGALRGEEGVKSGPAVDLLVSVRVCQALSQWPDLQVKGG